MMVPGPPTQPGSAPADPRAGRLKFGRWELFGSGGAPRTPPVYSAFGLVVGDLVAGGLIIIIIIIIKYINHPRGPTRKGIVLITPL